MLFIPAIDILDGRCVRLEQGDFGKEKRYSRDPADLALSFQDRGARYIHVVDLDAAKGGGRENREVIRRIVTSVSVPVEVGGGVRSRDTAAALLDIGVDRVILGTIIVRDEMLSAKMAGEFGSGIAAGIDARDGSVKISGWTEGGGVGALELGLKVKEMGFGLIIYTDISRDGMLKGPDKEGVKNMALRTGLPVIASGGISSIDDVKAVRELEPHGVVGMISGKAIYEGRISVEVACRISH
jgi:phosphoribosylformimino-5-aminoimidazole carboxamide ribotide isomerase